MISARELEEFQQRAQGTVDARIQAKGRAHKWFALCRLIGVAFFVFVLVRTDIGELWDILRSVDVIYLVVGVLFQCGVLIFKGLRWHVFNGANLSLLAIFRSMGQCLESYAVGVITPGRLGELLKVGHAKRHGASTLGATVWVLAERGMDVGLFVIAGGYATMYSSLRNIHPFFGGAGVVGGVLILLLAYMLLCSRSFLHPIYSLLRLLPVLRERRLNPPPVRRHREATAVLLLSILGTGSYFYSCHLLALGVGFTSPFVINAGAVAIAGLLTMLPITVMGMGTREAVFLYVFHTVSEGRTLAFSALVFLVAQLGGALLAMIGGQLALFASRVVEHRLMAGKKELMKNEPLAIKK